MVAVVVVGVAPSYNYTDKGFHELVARQPVSVPISSLMRASKLYVNLSHAWFLNGG